MIASVRTPLCDLLGIEYPIVQAPMAGTTTPDLVAAVSAAGGLGSFGHAYTGADGMRARGGNSWPRPGRWGGNCVGAAMRATLLGQWFPVSSAA